MAQVESLAQKFNCSQAERSRVKGSSRAQIPFKTAAAHSMPACFAYLSLWLQENFYKRKGVYQQTWAWHEPASMPACREAVAASNL